jgi:hypothetical protein
MGLVIGKSTKLRQEREKSIPEPHKLSAVPSGTQKFCRIIPIAPAMGLTARKFPKPRQGRQKTVIQKSISFAPSGA